MVDMTLVFKGSIARGSSRLLIVVTILRMPLPSGSHRAVNSSSANGNA